MPQPKCGLVVTSIGDGAFLRHYADQILAEDMADSCSIYVIPDLATDRLLLARCGDLQREGFQVFCPSVDEQDKYLKSLGDIYKIIPHNSDNRRNVGFLKALEDGCDYIISIDDDNFCRPGENFFMEHAVVCRPESSYDSVYSPDGWFNVCDLMDLEPGRIYPRGFPYYARLEPSPTEICRVRGTVHVNAGLWLQEPDVDAITWLACNPRARAFKGGSIVLGEGTWSPVNTQNTALHRDAIVSYYFIPMGHSLGGLEIDRYGDIFSGYFCQACARHLGYHVRFGTPVVDHIRNSHNYLRDLTAELGCIWIMEDITSWLQQVRLEGATYREAYLSLADALEEATGRFSGFIWTDEARDFCRYMVSCMRTWVETVDRIEGR